MSYRVLLVDDDDRVSELLSRFLSDLAYEVERLEDGETALQALREDPPDLLVLDIYLPKLGGLDLLHAMRMEGISTPVITMSGLPDQQMARDCLALGAADFLTKPFDLLTLEQDLKPTLDALGLWPPSGGTG
jgi:DNA-binding response OmpR family regulator